MSESRRRRKSEQSGASDEHSDSFDELNVTKETQVNKGRKNQHFPHYKLFYKFILIINIIINYVFSGSLILKSPFYRR